MRARIVAAALLVSCAPARPSQDQCDVEVYLQQDERDQKDPTDCGDFRSNDTTTTDTALMAARDCVGGAVAAEKPFRVVWDDDAPSGEHVRIAFTGRVNGASYELRQYVYQSTRTSRGDVNRTIDVRSCDTVYARNACTPTKSDTCLLCSNPQVPARLCQP